MIKLTLTHKKILAGLGLVAGIALLVGYLITQFFDVPEVISKFDLAFMTCGGLLLGQYGKYFCTAIFKPEKLRQAELEKNDERNQYMRGKAAYITLIVSIVIVAIIAVGINIFSDDPGNASLLYVAILMQVLCYQMAKGQIEKKM